MRKAIQQLEEENERLKEEKTKYKKAIEIMKKKCRFTFYEYNGRFDDDISIKGNEDYYDTTIHFSSKEKEEKEEYGLLKEVLNDEK